MVNFPTRIPDCDSPSSALLDSFLPADPTSIFSTVALPPLRNSDHVTSDFLPKSKGMPLFPAPQVTVLLLIVVVFVII